MSINQDAAIKLVLQQINKVYGESSDGSIKRELEIVEIIRYKNDGWIFFYDTKKSIETGDWRNGLVGSHPIFVFEDNGKMYSIYSDIDEEEIVRRHRQKYPLLPPDYHSTNIETQSSHPLLA
jgi:hypothetical protein